MTIVKPMLASPIESIKSLKYPLLASIKLDGIRALKINGKLVSRTFKAIPNNYIRSIVEKELPDGIDGELVVGNSFQDSSSGVMSRDGQPDFIFYVFDWVNGDVNEPFQQRFARLQQYMLSEHKNSSHFKLLTHKLIMNSEEMALYEECAVAEGHEGVMVRSVNGPYKCGRSSSKEGYLLKIKRFEDSEAEIIGFEEQMHNTNEAEEDNFGRTKRSRVAEGLVPAGILGTFTVRDVNTKVTFSIGTGLNNSQRVVFWKQKTSLLGKVIKYKYQPTGILEAPRFPVFLGFRDPSDM